MCNKKIMRKSPEEVLCQYCWYWRKELEECALQLVPEFVEELDSYYCEDFEEV